MSYTIEKLNIAIIGSGISGLSAGYLLSKKHNVTLYEKYENFGFSRNRFIYNNVIIDVPSRVVAEGYYENLLKLYRHLGINLLPTSAEASVYDESGNIIFNIWYTLKKRLYLVSPLNLFDALKFYHAIYFKSSTKSESYGQWIDRCKLRENFYEVLWLNTLGWVLTADYATTYDYPAVYIIRFIKGKKKLLPTTSKLYKVHPSIAIVAEALSEGFQNIYFSTNICEVSHDNSSGKVDIWFKDENNNIIQNRFDRVIFATDPQTVSRLFSSLNSHEKELFYGFKVNKSKLILHTDESLLPNPDNASNLNITSSNDMDSGISLTMVLNYCMTTFNFDKCVMETWNPKKLPKEDKILQSFDVIRSHISIDNIPALEKIEEIQGKYSTYYVGAYSTPGVTLLEDALTGSIHVAKNLG